MGRRLKILTYKYLLVLKEILQPMRLYGIQLRGCTSNLSFSEINNSAKIYSKPLNCNNIRHFQFEIVSDARVDA